MASGMLSFYLPPAPTTFPDLVDEFVDVLLAQAPDAGEEPRQLRPVDWRGETRRTST